MSVDSKMTAIADAIRAKTGGTEALTLDQMATEIAGIEAGGGGGFPNGTEWTQSNVTSGAFYKVKCNDRIFVAGGSTGLWYSTDGITWTQSNVTSGFTNAYSLIYEGGLWLAGGATGLRYSTDGITWTQTSTPGLYIHYGNGMFVASQGTNMQNGLRYSTDGITWNHDGNLGSGNNSIICGYADGIWIAGTASKGLWYSTDGITWTQSNVVGDNYSGNVIETISNPPTIVRGGGVWIYGTESNGLWYSTDGITWTQSNVTSGSASNVIWSNGVWVARSSQSGVCYSTDGITWTVALSAYTSATTNVGCSGGLFCVTDKYGNTRLSANGAEWISVQTSGGSVFEYSNGVLVQGGRSNGALYYSNNGTTWAKSNVSDLTVNNVCNARGVWVAACGAGIQYSVTWKPSE